MVQKCFVENAFLNVLWCLSLIVMRAFFSHLICYRLCSVCSGSHAELYFSFWQSSSWLRCQISWSNLYSMQRMAVKFVVLVWRWPLFSVGVAVLLRLTCGSECGWQMFKQFRSSSYYVLNILAICCAEILRDKCLTSVVFVFSRGGQEGSDWGFFSLPYFLSSWIHMFTPDWSVLPAAGKCLELHLIFCIFIF